MIFRKTRTNVPTAITSANPGPNISANSVASPLSSHPQRAIPPTKPKTAAREAATADRTDAKTISPSVSFIRGQIIPLRPARGKLQLDSTAPKNTKAQDLHPGPWLIPESWWSYSAAASTGLVVATVQSGAPTLKRAKRRTVMFSPSLPTFCAISSLMLTVWSLMKGCSTRQTSS